MWPFTRRRIVDDDTAAWHLENFTWLLQEFGGNGAFARLQLVLPKPGYFAADGKRDHAFALRIFDQVRAYCGMADWETDLVADDNPLARRSGAGADLPQAAPCQNAAADGAAARLAQGVARQRRGVRGSKVQLRPGVDNPTFALTGTLRSYGRNSGRQSLGPPALEGGARPGFSCPGGACPNDQLVER